MKKNLNLEKCKSSNKGITLIALVITIIVLLILAGVTIAQLTGSDSAPAKANEAKQKNDIGAMKDEITITAQNAQMEAYEDVYAGNVDLVLSGHAHGGQFRIPFVGGLVAPGQGFFPEYYEGSYIEDNTEMIVSRGIGNSIIPFRINNKPEIIVAELTKIAE